MRTRRKNILQKKRLGIVLMLSLIFALGLTVQSAFADDPAASIGSTNYDTLQAALDAAQDGQTVELLKDVTENVTFGDQGGYSLDAKSVTLDLAGHGITGKPNGGSVILIYNGTLTVADSKSTVGEHKYSFNQDGLAKLDENGEESFTGGYITGGTGTPDQGYYTNENRGGGIYIWADYNTASEGILKMTGGTVIGNTAEQGGGFFSGQSPWADEQGTTPVSSEFSNVAFIGNTALSGGGLYCAKTSCTVTDTIIEKNIAYGEEEDNEGSGGGLHFWGSGSEKVVFDKVVFSGNKANSYGGGLSFNSDNSDIEMKNCTVTGNEAKNGGGGSFSSAVVPMMNTKFTANTAVNGGAIHVSSSTVSPKDADCQITGNNADYGGGIFMESGTLLPYAGSIIGNTATKAGGGVYCEPNAYSEVTICPQGNPVIANNVSGNSKITDNVYFNKRCYVGYYNTTPPTMTSGASIGITLYTEEGDGRFTDIADENLAASIKQYFSADDSVRLYVKQGDLSGEDTDELYLVMNEIPVKGPAYITKDGEKVTSETEIKAGNVLKANVTEGTRLTYKWYHADEDGQPTGDAVGTGKSYTVKVADIDEKLVVVVSQEESDDLISDPTPKVKGLLEIHNLAELEEFQNNVNNGYDYADMKVRLMADIDMSEKYSETGEVWTPIGTNSKPFRGYFDGNDHSITGLYISDPQNDKTYVGLFGKAQRATIKDLTVSGEVEGKMYVGTMLGYSDGTKIENCSVENSNVKATDRFVGGLVGYAYYSGYGESFVDTTITDCKVDENTKVTGNRHVGGIVASISNGSVIGCQFDGEAKAEANYVSCVGGIVGETNRYNAGVDKKWEITDCVNTGTVSGSVNCSNNSDAWIRIGGIAGYSVFDMENCYNEGPVSLTEYSCPYNSQLMIGGLAGRMDSGKVEHCYNIGEVTDSSNVAKQVRIGGLIGSYEYAGEGNVLNNYNAGNVSISSSYETASAYSYSCAGGLVGAVTNTGNTTAFTNCHSFGTVSKTADVKTEFVFGIVGNDKSENNSFTACYYNSASPGDTNGTGLDAEGFKVEQTFKDAGWDFDAVWEMNENHPVFKAGPQAIDFKETGKEVTYDGKTITIPPAGMFTIPEGAGEAAYEVTAGTGEGTYDSTTGKLTVTKAGTFTIKISTAATEKYEAGEATATLTVKKGAGAATVTLGDQTYGTSYDPTIESTDYSTAAEDLTIKYQKKNGELYTDLDAKPTEVGEYKVVVTFKATDLYEAKTVTADYKIVQADADIKANDTDVDYDGESITIPVDGMFVIPEGSGKATYSVEPVTGEGSYDSETGKLTVTKVGTFKIKVNTAETESYKAGEQEVTLTVNKGEGKADVTLGDQKYGADYEPVITADEYSTDAQDVTIKYLKKDGGKYVELTGKPTEPGEYRIAVTFKETEFYKERTVTADFKIVADPQPSPAQSAYATLTAQEKAQADTLAKAYGVDKDTAAEMLKVGEKYGVSMDTMMLNTKAITNLPNDKDPKGTTFSKLRAKAVKRGTKTMTLQWKKQSNADGYLIYANKCGKQKPKLSKTIKNPKTTKWARKGLKKQTYYKYVVVAYKNVKGQKLPIAAAVMVHCTTKAKKHTIAKGVKVNKTKVTLKAGKTFKVKAKEIKAEKKKTIKKHRSISYESQNPKVATVSKTTGKIKAVRAGKTYVFAYAQDGVFKKIKVIVK